MQLADHHTLGSIDDEGPSLRHERKFAHIDFLLANVQDLLLGTLVFLVEDNETNAKFQRNGERHPLLEAFPLIIFRGTQ